MNAEKTTLTVQDASGVPHIIHSDEFGISAIVDCLQRLSQLEKAKHGDEWISVKDRMPKSREVVLVHGGTENDLDCDWECGGGHCKRLHGNV